MAKKLSEDLGNISFNNLAQNSKNFKSKVQDSKSNKLSYGINKKTQKSINDLVISSNKAIILATKLAGERNKNSVAQHTSIPDRARQLRQEKSKIRSERTSTSVKSTASAVLSIDKNVKKIYNILNNKFGKASLKKIDLDMSNSESYDAKRLGKEDGKKWKASITSFIGAAIRQSSLKTLNVDQDSHFQSRFGEDEKKKGLISSAIRAYKIASDETTMSIQEKMLKALLDMNRSISGEQSVFKLVSDRLMMEHGFLRETLATVKELYGGMMTPYRIYKWATRSRGGYESKLPKGKGTAEHTAAVLDMIYVDSMYRLDNITHHLKQQYNLWNQYITSQSGIAGEDPTNIASTKYSFMPSISKIFGKIKDKISSAREMPEYEKYVVTSKDLLEKQVQIGHTQVKLLKIIAQKSVSRNKKAAIDAIEVGVTDADKRMHQDDFYTDKDHPGRMADWKVSKWKEKKFGSLDSEMSDRKKIIQDRKDAKLYKKNLKKYKKNQFNQDFSDRTNENFELAKQQHPNMVKAVLMSKNLAVGSAKSASDFGKSIMDDTMGGLHGSKIAEKRIQKAHYKQGTGQDNITDRLVLKFDQLISLNSIGNKLQRNSYRLSFKSFLSDEKERFKAKNKDKWWYKLAGTIFGKFKSSFLSIGSLLGSIATVLIAKSGIKGLWGAVKASGFGKQIATKMMKPGVAAGAAGFAMMGMDAYSGVKKAKEWGTSKTAAGIGGALGGYGDGGAAGALKGVTKGGMIGAGIGTMVGGPFGTAIGGAIGAVAGGILGYVGGKNIAKTMQWIGTKIKNVVKGIAKVVMLPVDGWRMIAKFMSDAWTKIKDKLANVGSGIYKYLYDNIIPSFAKPFLPKPGEKKSIAESAQAAVDGKKKENKKSGGMSLVDVDILDIASKERNKANWENQKTSSNLITQQMANKNKQAIDKNANKFDFTSIRPGVAEAASAAKVVKVAAAKVVAEKKIKEDQDKTDSRLAAIPLNTKQAKSTLQKIKNSDVIQLASEATSELWEGTKKIGRNLVGAARINNPEFMGKVDASKAILQQNYTDKIAPTMDIWTTRAEGFVKTKRMKWNQSDAAHQVSIYKTLIEGKGKNAWNKFKKTEQYKMGKAKYDEIHKSSLMELGEEFVNDPKSRGGTVRKLQGELGKIDIKKLGKNLIGSGINVANDAKELVIEQASTLTTPSPDAKYKHRNTELIGKKKKSTVDKLVEISKNKKDELVNSGEVIAIKAEHKLKKTRDSIKTNVVNPVKKQINKAKESVTKNVISPANNFIRNQYKQYIGNYQKNLKEYRSILKGRDIQDISKSESDKLDFPLGRILTNALTFVKFKPDDIKDNSRVEKDMRIVGSLATSYMTNDTSKNTIRQILSKASMYQKSLIFGQNSLNKRMESAKKSGNQIEIAKLNKAQIKLTGKITDAGITPTMTAETIAASKAKQQQIATDAINTNTDRATDRQIQSNKKTSDEATGKMIAMTQQSTNIIVNSDNSQQSNVENTSTGGGGSSKYSPPEDPAMNDVCFSNFK